MPAIPRIGIFALAFLVGLVPGFFIAFNVVFSDVFGMADHALALVVVVASYGVIGLMAGAASPTQRWQIGVWLALPAVLLLAWYTTREPQRVLWHLLVILSAVAASVAGAEAGGRMRSRRMRKRA